MIFSLAIIHQFSIVICTVLTCFGVSIGQGITANASIKALDRQPKVKDDIARTTLLALAIIETAGLLGFIASIFLFLEKNLNFYSTLSEIGFSFAISIPGFILGIITSLPAQTALQSIARQPFMAKKIMNFMLLTQSLIQTPLAFGFIIAMLIRNNFTTVSNIGSSIALISSGLCIGLGCIGPAIGAGKFARMACLGTGLNKSVYARLVSFTIISQAIIETPVIFSAIISFWLTKASTNIDNVYIGIICIAAAFVMGIGTFGPGISSGKIAVSACFQIAQNPNIYGSIARTSMIAQGIIDTAAIYAFIIALFLILTI